MCVRFAHILTEFGKTTFEVIVMFSQRRKKYKNMVWASVLTAVAILALVALLGYLGSFRDKNYEETPASEVVSTPQEAEEFEEDKAEDDSEEESAARDEKKQTYYLLKYDNDVVRVYFSDQQGKLTELEETDIVYETLSIEDQQQFLEGIQVENRDALNRLLMDYES